MHAIPVPTEAGHTLAAGIPDSPPPRRLFTIKAFAERHSSFLTVPALNNQIHKAKPRHSTRGIIPGNGLEEAGAIVRSFGRVYIDEDRYFACVSAQQARQAQAA